MKEILKQFKIWVIIWFWIVFTLSISWWIYAAINNSWTNPESLEVNKSDILSSESWNSMLSNFNSLKQDISWLNEAPKDAVMAFAKSECPLGWIPADWTAWTPDLRWVFIRWANSFDNWLTSNARDEDRAEALQNTVVPWNYNLQEDAIRNIEWYIDRIRVKLNTNFDAGWAFTGVRSINSWDANAWNADTTRFNFNASNVVPTWKDNRPKNVALIYCVKQ